MTEPNWDYDMQQAATRYTVAQLLAEDKIPENAEITLELFFVPGQNPNAEALIKALKTFGYNATAEQESLTNGGTQIAILIAVENIKMTADTIWLHEERTTNIALSRGYTPDGWGFLEP